MNFGLTESQRRYLDRTVIEPLDSLGCEVWVFGSRARGDHQPFSDLDLMVIADKPLGSLLGDIRETLERGNFPFKVDLVDYRDFADSFKPSYQRDRVRWPRAGVG